MINLAAKEMNILLVEDDPIVMLVHRRILKNLGYSFDTAVNGKEALEKSAKGYDLIFMDIGLPDISGIEVTAKIRQVANQQKRPVIIALTAYAQEELHAECRAVGIDDVVLKPLEHDQLKNICKKFAV